MNIEVLKCHGSGNDFLIIDEMSHNYIFTEEKRAELAKALCNRQTELGADGILFVMKSEKADGRMRVFNADGSEASMCGNGLRCVARYVCELINKETALIETMKADLLVKKEEDIYPEIPTYLVEISPVLFDLKALPLNLEKEVLVDGKIPELSNDLTFTALAVPNPHIVTIVDEQTLQSNVQEKISTYVNGANPLFPDGVNVSFVKPIQKGHIFVRTYERGVGFTNACGTAMSASTLVTCLQGLNELEQSVDVYNPGGKVRCVVHKNDETYTIDLIGNATYVYKTVVEVDVSNPTSFNCGSKEEFTSEGEQYQKLQQHIGQFLNN
ncbi:diaminopimelate epimerase [Bacillus sp. 31A1R]|uniref:Diaminopimelate epimerase n=1 Tax=Robertmurraya mangrovi TaxID=3098077 RepID=A0ABU5J313_9BACI|nr:diaminopimelate epimerase [Bacillus sp. 31A1R]MDZ5473805.1 diaminopimelate epimerase [Bacillus sp. 31A1R]